MAEWLFWIIGSVAAIVVLWLANKADQRAMRKRDEWVRRNWR